MRLIDADKLINVMNDRYNEKVNNVPDNLAEGFMQMEKLIKEQPTIFDVEQLEEFKEYKKNKHRSLRYMYEKGYNKAIDDLTNKLTSDEFQKYNLDFVFETSKSLSYNECISAFCEYIEKIAEELKECAE